MKRFAIYNRLLEGETLGWVGSKRIVRELTLDEFNLLLSLLNHKKSRLRWQAADKLGKLSDRRAIDPLTNALQDSNWLVRFHATKALGRIGAATSVEAIVSMAKDECPYVRRVALISLRQDQFIQDERVTETLLNALSDINAIIRAEAVWSLSYSIPFLVVSAIADAAKDPNNNVSWRAIHALQRIGEPATGVLIQLLQSPNEEVRYRAVKTLGRIRNTRSLEAIKKMTADPSEKVRRRSEWELRLRKLDSIQQSKYSDALNWLKVVFSTLARDLLKRIKPN